MSPTIVESIQEEEFAKEVTELEPPTTNTAIPTNKEINPADAPNAEPAKEVTNHTPAQNDGEPEGEASETSPIAKNSDPLSG